MFTALSLTYEIVGEFSDLQSKQVSEMRAANRNFSFHFDGIIRFRVVGEFIDLLFTQKAVESRKTRSKVFGNRQDH